MTAIVFDIGNVLVRWDPRAAFRRALGSDEAVDAFLERTDFHARNLRADRGERFGLLAQEIQDPDDRALFAAYVQRYAMTISDPIEGTWEIVDRLKRRGHALHAITNWSAETWPIGITLHPRLQEVFGVTIVSGQVHLAKPEKAIFDLLCRRTGLDPAQCIFVDDSPVNVDGAIAAGMDAVQFTDPAALDAALTGRGLL